MSGAPAACYPGMNRLVTQDFLAGVLFMAFGVAALAFGTDLRVGTAARMGPGFVPTALAWILIALGGFITIRGFFRRHEVLESLHWRPIALISVAIFVFALLFERTGILPALAAMVALAALASPESRRLETVMVALVLLVICVGAFKYGLGMQFTVIRGVW